MSNASFTQKPPFWWKGNPEEWNRIPVGDREMLRSMVGTVRDKEAERLLAGVRGQQYKPEQEHVKSASSGAVPAKQKAPQHFYGIRNWTESLPGYTATRVRNVILYLLEIKKDPWYLLNCNNRAFVMRNIDKMNSEVPEEFVYDRDAVVQSRRIHVPGEPQPVVLTEIKRAPETEEERVALRDRFGVCDATIKYLAKGDCSLCHGKGFVDVSDYPDDPIHSKLTHSDACSCVFE